MQPTPTNGTTERTALERTAPTRRSRPILSMVAAAALLVPSAAALAQGEADPSEVVVASLGDATVTLEAFELRFEAEPWTFFHVASNRAGACKGGQRAGEGMTARACKARGVGKYGRIEVGG